MSPLREVFIGRQPIYDRKLQVYGYELLFRAGDFAAANVIDEEHATSQVLANTFIEFGLDRVVDTGLAFINFSPTFLLENSALPFSPAQVALEISDDAPVGEAFLKAVAAFSSQGYAIVLDNFRFHEKRVPLVELADIVKLDVRTLDAVNTPERLERLRGHKVRLLATRLETKEQFNSCVDKGFDYFQGYFLCRPEVLKRDRLPPGRLAVLQVLAALQQPDIDIADLERLVGRDLTLSYKLLRYLNSACIGLSKEVESVKRAITYLGLREMKRWVRLVALAGVDDQPHALMLTALMRARMCELLGEAASCEDTDSFFTVGLFSALDAILRMPMDDILKELPLADEVSAALLRHEGRLGEALGCVLAHEHGRWAQVRFGALTADTINSVFTDAIDWSRQATSGLAAMR